MRTIRTSEKRAAFLEELATGNSITAASQLAGFARTAAFKWRNEDEAFAADWEDAVEAGTDTLEDIAVARAKDKSDLLLIFMLKGRRPEKFKDRAEVEHKGNVVFKMDFGAGLETPPAVIEQRKMKVIGGVNG